MAYSTQQSLLNSYDSRLIGQMISDSGFAADTTGINAVITQFLQEASDMVTAACEVGGRYTAAQLAGSGSALLARIVNDLTFGLIMSRRGRSVDSIAKVCPRYPQALQTIDELRQGIAIIPGISDLFYEEAGTPNSINANLPIPGVPYCPLIAQQAHRLFPVQSQYGNGNGAGY